MKVQLKKVVDAMPAMAVFANALDKETSEKEPEKVRTYLKATVKERYSVAKLVKAMSREHQDYLDARNVSVKKFGEKRKVQDGNGGTREGWVVKDEHDEEFKAEDKEMLDKEVELGEVVVIPWSYVEKVNPTPAVMSDLMDFMEAPPA